MWLLRKILFPISILYMGVVYLRNYLYDKGVFTSKSYATPIICVGNLSTGGTGKTPMIEYLISLLQPGNSVAVLSRGYRRKSKGYRLASADSNVEQLGDEPFQIFSKFPKTLLAVDADRRNGIAQLEKLAPDVILLDDGYQHRKVKPGLSILLTSFNKLYTKDMYLPTGNLRDSKKEAKRANLIIVTKCPEGLSAEAQKNIVAVLRPRQYQKILFSFLSYDDLFTGVDAKISKKDLKDKKVTLVTGIADPAPLVVYLSSIGVVFEHLKFKDHHFFTKKELGDLDGRDCVLTTEKDFVRLKGKLQNLFYISVKHRFMGDHGIVLKKELEKFMGQYR